MFDRVTLKKLNALLLGQNLSDHLLCFLINEKSHQPMDDCLSGPTLLLLLITRKTANTNV